MATKLSDLTASTLMADADIMHLRTVGAIDKKITYKDIRHIEEGAGGSRGFGWHA